MTRVFVYGTLKRGGSNHSFLAAQSFLGAVRTAPGYILYSLGDYPDMVRMADDTTGVVGELWAVDDAGLKQLDLLEGVAEGLYERLEVQLAPNRLAGSAQTYLYTRPFPACRPSATIGQSEMCNTMRYTLSGAT